MAKKVYVSPAPEVSLPSGYTPVEYIQSSGTQYIDTGFKPNQNTRVVCKAVCEVSSVANWVFGARTSNSSNMFSFLGASAGYYRSDYATELGAFSTSLNTTEAITIDKNKNITTINGANAVTATAATFSAPVNLALFAVNTNGTISCGSVRIYSCQIYDNGTLIRDFVPCKNASSVVGLYDVVNDVFYANAGTGTFTAGASTSGGVAREGKKIYVGVDAVARNVKSGYVGVDAVARQFWSSGKPASEFAVGDSVYLKEMVWLLNI